MYIERFIQRNWLTQLGRCTSKSCRVGWQLETQGRVPVQVPEASCWENSFLLRRGQSLFSPWLQVIG